MTRIIATVFSRLGDGWLYFAIILYIVVYEIQPAPYAHAIALAVCMALSTALMLTIKPLVGHARPEPRRTLIHADHYAFPSGHAMTAFAFAVCCGEFYHRLFIPLIVFAVCVAVSRVILRVHYWGDVLVAALWGAVLGYGCAEVTGSLLNK